MIDLASQDQFEDVVLKATLPVLVYITASWCVPCKTLRPLVEAYAQEIDGKAIVVRVDADALRPLVVGKLGIKGVPTLMVYKDGQEVTRHTGTTTKERLVELLAL